MTSISVSNAQEAKQQLETHIQTLISQFEATTGLTVEELQLTHLVRLGHPRTVSRVHCKVEL